MFQIKNVDLDIKNKMKSVTIMGKCCARFIPNDIETRKLVSARLKELRLNKNEYFQRLGFHGGYDRGIKKTDNQIKAYLKEAEDKDRPGWISTSGDWPGYYERAHCEHMKFREFIKFFGYNVEEGEQKDVIGWYAFDHQTIISDLVIDSGGKYAFNDNKVKHMVANYAHIRNIPYDLFIQGLINEWKQLKVFIEPIPHDSFGLIETDQRLYQKDSITMAKLDEEDLEHLLSIDDSAAGYAFTDQFQRIRKCNKKIVRILKEHYKGRCQLCGSKPFPNLEDDITEAHHIEYFSKSFNNNASNIIIVCPNHHRVLHKYGAVYNRENNEFRLNNGQIWKVKFDLHLQR